MLSMKILVAMVAVAAASRMSTTQRGGTGGMTTDRPLPTLAMKTDAPRIRNITCDNCTNTGVAPGGTRDVLKDPSLTSTRPNGCDFPTVQVPNPTRYSRLKLCTIIQSLKRNATYVPYLPNYCICKATVRLLAYSACASASEYFDMFYLLRLIQYLDRLKASSSARLSVRLTAAALSARLKAMANSMLGNNEFNSLVARRLLDKLREDTQIRMCRCYDLLVAAARRLILASDPRSLATVRATLDCVVDGDRGTGLGLLKLVNIVQNLAPPARIRELCPTKGCCAARVTLRRRVVIRRGNGTMTMNYTDERNFGGIVGEVTGVVCTRFIAAVAGAVSQCSRSQGFALVSSDANFAASDPFCVMTKRAIFRTAVAEFANRIRYTAAMCRQDNLLDRSCVATFVENAQSGDIRNTNRTRVKEAIITATNRLRRFAAAAQETLQVRLRNKSETVGEARADQAGTCEVETTDSSGEGRFDYAAAIGVGAKVLTRLRKMIVNQRLDLDSGVLEGGNNMMRGDVEVDGVFTAQRGSELRNVRAILRNAAVFKGSVRLRRASKIICEGSVLLDNTTVEGDNMTTPAPGGYEIECNGTSAVIIGARGGRSFLRTKTRSVTLQVDENGEINIEAETNVQTVITTPNSKLRIGRRTQVVIDDVDGDGDLDVEADSTLVISKTVRRARLILRNRAILRCARNPTDNTTRNASSPADVTSIDTDVDVPDSGRLEVVGRALLVRKALRLRRAAKLLLTIRRNDALGGNDSAPIVCENFTSEWPRNMTDGVQVDIDAETLCKYAKRIVLMKVKGTARLPARALVRLLGTSTCGALGRRRLQGQGCNLVQVGDQIILDCNPTPPTTTGNPMASTTAAGSPGSTTGQPAPTPSRASVVSISSVFALAIFSTFFAC